MELLNVPSKPWHLDCVKQGCTLCWRGTEWRLRVRQEELKNHHRRALICYDHQYRTQFFRNKRTSNSDMTRMLPHALSMNGDSACALTFQGKPKWMPTVIENRLGPLTFAVHFISLSWLHDRNKTKQNKYHESYVYFFSLSLFVYTVMQSE